MRAVTKVDPFVMKQLVFVFDDNNLEENIPTSHSITLEELSDFLSGNNIDEVHLVGQEDYLQKFAQEVREKGLNKYNKNIKIFINE